MQAPARELLTVIWDGEIVPGVTFYGLTAPGRWTGGKFPADSWPTGTEVKESRLGDAGWEVIVWDVAVGSWPRGEAWRCAGPDSTAQIPAPGRGNARPGRAGVFL